MKSFNRVFTFGCSFTSFNWPTWADLLIGSLGIEGYNLGASGAGNLYIQNRFWEAYKKFNITKDDLVVFVWTTPQREDRWLGGDWSRMGNLYTAHLWSDDFKKNIANDYHYYMLTLSVIFQTKTFLDSIGIKYGFYYMNELTVNEYEDIPGIEPEHLKSMIKFWGISTENYPSMMKYLNLRYRESRYGKHTRPQIKYQFRDDFIHEHHPIPSEQLRYLQDIIAKDLNLSLDISKIQNLLDEYSFLDDFSKPIYYPEDKYYGYNPSRNDTRIKTDYHHIADFYTEILRDKNKIGLI